jgi:NHL repeat
LIVTIFSPTASNFEAPVGVAVDGSGNVYVDDTGDSRVLEFSSSCASTACSATRVYGQTSFTSSDAGLTASGLYVPRGVAVDSRGTVYVADGNNRVLGGLPVGVDTNSSPAITNNPPSPASAPADATASAPEVAAPSPPGSVGPPSAPESAAVPDTLPDSLRADILAAVDRGNAAWSAAQQSLDAADLQGGLTGQELSTDTSQLAQFRSMGQRKNPLNTAFTVLDVSLDSPTRSTVHTQETWSDAVYISTTGALIRQDPPTNYSETYTVDLIDGRWTLSQIQLQ